MLSLKHPTESGIKGETMNNNGTNSHLTNAVGKSISAVVSAAGATTSWVDQLEQAVRMMGSAVALLSGVVFLYFTVTDRIKNKKHKTKR